MEKFNASNASYESRIDLVDHLLSNMKVQQSGNSTTGILMAGDPGVGKTSFARFFSRLMGLTLITIEAPHITEEHVINIPFIVFNSVRNTNKTGNQAVEVSPGSVNLNDYKLVLADSHLFGEMNRAHVISDEELLHSIYSGPKDLIQIFENCGGSETELPQTFKDLRKKYSVILFLDEFFRQSSMRIRNILRGILNGKIGSHDMPSNVYVLYASNLATDSSATGIEGIPLNTDFNQLEFHAPAKDDWFAYLVNKFKDDSKVKLDMNLIEKFHKLLEQEHLNFNDVDKQIRVSPRRWEQLLLYINAALPVADVKEAKVLITNVKASFKNYESGEHVDIVDAVVKAVEELILDTSNISISGKKTMEKSEWRDTLQHQIHIKKVLGEHRSYVPIVSGQPGVGKTTHMMKIAKSEDLRYIYVDCANLDPEDSTGIPLSKQKEDGGIELHFSFPKLYRQIIEDCEQQDNEYKAKMKSLGKDISDYDQREWKYLIFFDEMNRTSIKVFNALRRVILEKDFGDGHKLPKEAIVVAAINPTDIGTTSLSGHMRDVVDVIDSAPSWKSTSNFLSNDISFKNQIEPEMADKIIKVVEMFAEKFKTQDSSVPEDEKAFNIEVGSDRLYISPREYVAMVSNCIELVNLKLERLLPKFLAADNEDLRKELAARLTKEIRGSVFKAMKGIISNVQTKHTASNPEFMGLLEAWIMSQDELDIMVKQVETLSFDKIMDHYYDKENADLSDEIEFTNNYIQNIDLNEYTKDLRNFLLKHVTDKAMLELHILEKKYQKKSLVDNEIKWEEDQVSKVEHFIRELIHAFKINNISNEFVAATKTGVLEFLKNLNGLLDAETKKLHQKPFMEFGASISKFMKQLNN